MPDETQLDQRAIAEFQRSLPAEYRKNYTAEQIAAHAKLSRRRSGSAEVGRFGARGAITGVCIVATDRPGLFSGVTEAFVVCGLDVVEAEGFTRQLDDETAEAVDLFWLRKGQSSEAQPLTERDLSRLRTTLIGLLEGDRSADPLAQDPNAKPQVSRSDSRVRFIEDASGALCTLEVETDDRSGLLLSLARALTAQGVQIVRSEVKTIGTRVVDRFSVTELDGSPVAPARRLELQVGVLSAAEPAKRLSTPAPPGSFPIETRPD